MRDMHQMNSAETNQQCIEQKVGDATLFGVEDHSNSSAEISALIAHGNDHNIAGHVGLTDNIWTNGESDTYSLSAIDEEAVENDSYSEDSLDDVDSIVEEKLSQDSLDDPLRNLFQPQGGLLTETATWDLRNTVTLHNDSIKYNTQNNEQNIEVVNLQVNRLPSFSSLNDTEEHTQTQHNYEEITNLPNNLYQDSAPTIPGLSTDTNGNTVELFSSNALIDSLEGPLDENDDTTDSTVTTGTDRTDPTEQPTCSEQTLTNNLQVTDNLSTIDPNVYVTTDSDEKVSYGCDQNLSQTICTGELKQNDFTDLFVSSKVGPTVESEDAAEQIRGIELGQTSVQNENTSFDNSDIDSALNRTIACQQDCLNDELESNCEVIEVVACCDSHQIETGKQDENAKNLTVSDDVRASGLQAANLTITIMEPDIDKAENEQVSIRNSDGEQNTEVANCENEVQHAIKDAADNDAKNEAVSSSLIPHSMNHDAAKIVDETAVDNLQETTASKEPLTHDLENGDSSTGEMTDTATREASDVETAMTKINAEPEDVATRVTDNTDDNVKDQDEADENSRMDTHADVNDCTVEENENGSVNHEETNSEETEETTNENDNESLTNTQAEAMEEGSNDLGQEAADSEVNDVADEAEVSENAGSIENRDVTGSKTIVNEDNVEKSTENDDLTDDAPKNISASDSVIGEKPNKEPTTENVDENSPLSESAPEGSEKPDSVNISEEHTPQEVVSVASVVSCETNDSENITFGICTTENEDTPSNAEPEEDPDKDLPVITYTVTSNIDEEPVVPKPAKKPGTFKTIKGLLSVLFSKRKKRRVVVNAEGEQVEEEYEVVVDAMGNEVEVQPNSNEASPVVEKQESLTASNDSLNKDNSATDNVSASEDGDGNKDGDKAVDETAIAERKKKFKEAGTQGFFAAIFRRQKEPTAPKEELVSTDAAASESESQKDVDGTENQQDGAEKPDVDKQEEGEPKAGEESNDDASEDNRSLENQTAEDDKVVEAEKPKFKTLAKKGFFARLFSKQKSNETAESTEEAAADALNDDVAESESHETGLKAAGDEEQKNEDENDKQEGDAEEKQNDASASEETEAGVEEFGENVINDAEKVDQVGVDDGGDSEVDKRFDGSTENNENEGDDVACKDDNDSEMEKADITDEKTENTDDSGKVEANEDAQETSKEEKKPDAKAVFKVGFFASLFKKKKSVEAEGEKDNTGESGEPKTESGDDVDKESENYLNSMPVAVDKETGKIFVPEEPIVENMKDMDVAIDTDSMKIYRSGSKTDSNDYELDTNQKADTTFDLTVDKQLHDKFYKSINEEGIMYEGDGTGAQDCVPEPHVFEPDSEMFNQAETMRKQLQEGEVEVRAPMDSYDQEGQEGSNSRITLEAMGLKIGDRVIVGGVKSGILRFCGKTQFASGIWAGIELDEPAGKNDGSVSGVTYFKCSPKHGIFAPVNKICREGMYLKTPSHRGNIDHGLIDTSHVTAKVDTGLYRRRVGSAKHPGVGEELEVGERVLVAGQRKGVIKFAGQTHFAPGWWYGIELDRPVGKNDGSVNGTRYFTSKPKHGVFAPQSRVQRIPDTDRKNSSDSIVDHQRLAGVNNSESDSSHGVKKQNTRPRSSESTRSTTKQYPAQTDAFTLQKGMSVFCNNELGTLRYIGPVDFADGVWLGVELRTPRGKNDGSVQGKRYFTCHQNYGVLVRPSKVTVRGINGAKLLGDTN